jgi:hypothetical protein
VFPIADRVARQIGEHVAALAGQGGEFASVRPLVPGDSARRINWAVSSRRDELHVNDYWAERALDLVIAVDTFSDVGPAGRRSLDVAVRGAAATAGGYLRHHDRVGVVVLGGVLRWIPPDASARQFYRIVDYVLDMPGWESVVDPDIDRVPRQALPAGALVVVFTPLLDPRAEQVIRDLRQRGFPVVVVDVLTCEPPAGDSEVSRLALRLWRLDRVALRQSFAALDVPVFALGRHPARGSGSRTVAPHTSARDAAMIRRPTRADLPGLAAGTVMIGWTTIPLGQIALTVVGLLAVVAAAASGVRWPATVAAVVAVATEAIDDRGLLVAGLLIAAYLVLVDGPTRWAGLVPLAAAALLASAVVAAALMVPVQPSVWWVLAAAAAAPLALALATTGPPPKRERGDE